MTHDPSALIAGGYVALILLGFLFRGIGAAFEDSHADSNFAIWLVWPILLAVSPVLIVVGLFWLAKKGFTVLRDYISSPKSESSEPATTEATNDI